jgi:UDP-glucuronate decarboxylase
MRAADASALIAHPTSSRCYEVHTAYGRSIKVTGDHSLFVEGPGSRPVACPVDDLRVGDRVAVAARLEVPERDRPSVSMVEAWDAAGLDPWRLMVRAPELGPVVWERRQELLALLMRNYPRDVPHKRRMLWGEIHGHRRRGQLPLGAIRGARHPHP